MESGGAVLANLLYLVVFLQKIGLLLPGSEQLFSSWVLLYKLFEQLQATKESKECAE